MRLKRFDIAVVSSAYCALRRVFEFLVLLRASEDAKELEILVLRHQLAVLRRQVARPELRAPDRVLRAGLSQAAKRELAVFFIRSRTLLARHRQLAKRRWNYGGRRGRPPHARSARAGYAARE
jgi:putative transposase